MNQIALGKRIRSERQARGLTQEQLAEKANLSTTYIGFIERGERTMTLNTLTTIANELHVSVDYLLQDIVPLDPCPAGDDFKPNPGCFKHSARLLINQIGALSPIFAKRLFLLFSLLIA